MHAVVVPRSRTNTALMLVIALAVGYTLVWGAGLALSHISPPLDTAEEFAWAYALQGGYPKHPPLTTWLMHALISVFGPSVAMSFYATFACISIGLALSWRLAAEFMEPRRALLGLALSALVGYYGFNADAYNHNMVMLPFQAALVLCFYLAVRRGEWHLWALAGLFAGLAMLVKYVAVFPIAALVLYVLVDREVRVRRTFAGLLLAGAVAVLVLAPHLVWLRQHDFLPVQYMRSVTQPVDDLLEFISILYGFFVLQFLRLSPLLALFGWLLLRGRHAAAVPVRRPVRSDRLFLWVAGIGPLAIEVLYGSVMRTPMAGRWGSTMFLLAGWLLLDLAARRPLPSARQVWTTVIAVHAVIWAMTCVVTPRLASALDLHGRANYPGAQLAALVRSTWQAHTDAPLRIVIADVWLAGNVIAHSTPMAVMIDGEIAWSPWLTAEDVQHCGALVLRNRSLTEGPPPATQPWMDRATERGTWAIPWSTERPSGEPERIEWGILAPTPGAGCRL
jgi:4-amino-4-deoxy-L-arabinose transferase-like glycosyltransferase